jgi:hypothetical protein
MSIARYWIDVGECRKDHATEQTQSCPMMSILGIIAGYIDEKLYFEVGN